MLYPSCSGAAKLRMASALLLLGGLLILAVGPVSAGGGPRNVAVVINRQSAASVEIGKYYQQARHIPDRNICWISCPDDERVSGQTCEDLIRNPLRQFLQNPLVAGKIDYIVITKGVPLSADYGDTAGCYSVSSVLTCVEETDIQESFTFPYGPFSLWTYGVEAPEVAFSHCLDYGHSALQGRHFYLVTRLDAYTVDDVKSMIDHGLQPAVDGIFALDRNSYLYGQYYYANLRLGDQANSAYQALTDQGLEVQFDSGSEFISGTCGLMGYFSWSCHDDDYTYDKYVSNRFIPGSVGDTYFSRSGRTFVDPGTTDRDPLIADLIPQGLCAVGGYVSEPYVSMATYANVLFERYTKGFNMAESFYAACPTLFWKTVIVGDPLMSAYATPPEVDIQLPDTQLSDVETIQAVAFDDSGISRVEFYFDDDLIGEVAGESPYEIQIDTTRYAIGSHTVEAIAYEDTNIATQGSDRVEVVVDNAVSTVAHIGEVLYYPDGQSVSISQKVVSASTAEIGGSFFIEEADRSGGIRVVSDTVVERGDVVSIVGPVGQYENARAVINPSVQIVATGAGVPEPVMMPLRSLGGAQAGEYTVPVNSGCGARNVGLLVRVSGRVAASGEGEFDIDDGSSRTVRVDCPGTAAPGVGAHVSVTGLSAVGSGSPCASAVVRVRGDADVQILD